MNANGTPLAHPYRPLTAGQDRLNETDPNGVAYVKVLHDLVERGEGFDYTVRPNPADSNAMELKLNYVLKADEGLYLHSGISSWSGYLQQRVQERSRSFRRECQSLCLEPY